MSETLRFARNALSNVITGLSSAVFALLLPWFFVRDFSQSEFALWVLIFQLAAYVGYLNFGFQVAVGRYVAYSLERGDRNHAERITAAGAQTLGLLGLVGFAVVAAIAWAFPHIFHGVEPALVPQARSALLWIGGAIAMGLPFSVFLGVFVGLQRNEIPAIISVMGKVGQSAMLILAAALTHNLVTVSVVYFVGSLLQYLLQYIWFRRHCRDWRVNLLAWSWPETREIISYCASLSAWTFSMLLINGLDITIVGILDFPSVASYGLALSIVTFFAGTAQALFSPLIQVFARRHARENHDTNTRDLLTTSTACALLLFASCGWLAALAPIGFVAWVGPSLARTTIPIFLVLVVANALRNVFVPWSHYVVSTYQQQKVLLTPMLEGIINCAGSIILGWHFGAMGVAIATLCGVVCAVLANGFYNMPRTLAGDFSAFVLFKKVLALPILWAMPIILLAIWEQFFPLAPGGLLILATISVVPALSELVRLARQHGQRDTPHCA